MRKFLLILLISFSFTTYANDDNQIELHEIEYCEMPQRHETRTTFSAELLPNGSIKVLSSDITTFTVKICNASTGAVFYQETGKQTTEKTIIL